MTARVTGNGGLNMRNEPSNIANNRLIDEALANGFPITKIQPAGLPGNEACRSTRELIARRRREFRKAEREAVKRGRG
ncbi:MAG: hypothetical protein WCY93_12300 [Anaerolineaceae bacterium]